MCVYVIGNKTPHTHLVYFDLSLKIAIAKNIVFSECCQDSNSEWSEIIM